MKKKRKRFKSSWYDKYQAKSYRIVDENAIKEILFNYKKYGQVYSVMQYINYETIRMAFESATLIEDKEGNIYLNNKEKATGIDGVTKEEYGRNLNGNIEKLLIQLKTSKYKMKTVLRVYIPKEPKKKIINGKETIVIGERPLSIPSIEDSILQKTITNQILEPIMEEIFTEESFGYRPNKGVKEAIRYIEEINDLYDIKYVLILDIKSFFDNLNQELLINMLKEIYKDKRFIKLIKIIIKTGYIDIRESKKIKMNDKGIYQGLNISPILANLYLHNVIDIWYKTIRTKEKIFMVRYADDIVILGNSKEDIDVTLEDIKRRFNKYDLEISEDKTRKINFKEEDFTYLGYRFHKYGRNILKFISNKKIDGIKLKIDIIIKDSLTDIIDKDIKKYIRSYESYIRYLKDYIREINNLLSGIYRTYKDVDNLLVLDMLYDYACIEIRKHWSYSLSSTDIEFMIMHIIPPKIFN